MTTVILHSIKQGAYVAIALYIVLIAVGTVASMSPQLTTPQAHASSGHRTTH